MQRVLIANRGEVAVRIIRAARDLGIDTAIACGPRDADSLPTRLADRSVSLPGRGAAAYLDVPAVVAAARQVGADAVHPGYGFLAESALLARTCAGAGVTFVGPDAAALERLGHKPAALALARAHEVSTLTGTTGPTSVTEAEAFLADHGAMVIKAVAGGGGRGLRVVRPGADVAGAHERCRSEAVAAFGDGEVYVERYLERARHVEVQLVGDGSEVLSVGDRECTLQRRHQKLVEVAPSPAIDGTTRAELFRAAERLATAVGYRGIGTFEFLVDADDPTCFWFIEANARLQVEHTVTEETTGLDLVQIQLLLAAGATLTDLGLGGGAPTPRGAAIEVRVNAETITPEGNARPSIGTITELALPAGPGVRCDTAAHTGLTIDPGFDSMLVKLVARAGDHPSAHRRIRRALDELRVDGVTTNRGFLSALLDHDEVAAGSITTSFVADHLAELVEVAARNEATTGRATARSASDDAGADRRPDPVEPGTTAVEAPLLGTVVSVDVAEGDLVAEGGQLLVIESMKMEHVVSAPFGALVRRVTVSRGDPVAEGQPVVHLEPADVEDTSTANIDEVDPDHIRPDLAEVLDRHEITNDRHRPDKVARRHERGHRTARENVEDLVDPGSFVEYGPLMVAAQRRRRSIDDLIENTAADGLVAGIGAVNGELFEGRGAQAVVLSYDYMVLAGTQGMQNHRKKDRLFEIAETQRLPVVIFTEGGGGRPGDVDYPFGSGLDCLAFLYFAALSGLVPVIGINNGPCFAGNAALLGCCDVVIATESSSIGMGGPAMIEGGGLGVYAPEEVGPVSMQVPNGVVDIAVADEAEAVEVAKRYLSYFQGPVDSWACADQRRLRHLIPENRLRTYRTRDVIEAMFDRDSVLELRAGWGHGMVTALARVEGRPVGVIANDPSHLAGAIDSDAADKASRFMQLCDAHDLPIVFLCDTPGIMVGPDAERRATVRHAARMFVTGASLDVPVMTMVLRKGYGLGAQAMAGGSFKAGLFTVAWPTGEFGGMGLEGAARLGYRKELEAIDDPDERRARLEQIVARMYEAGKAVATATVFEIDDVIDPADSRRWIVSALRSSPPPAPRTVKKRPMVDPW